ncbi:hypothetical protein VNO77_04924 [Canavalia gladiata]|uniref:SHSP domain-containing protein n=1 Tax=Canavalia gladiata TaxID=3824 RepID=A0AAN9MZF0_CANGL
MTNGTYLETSSYDLEDKATENSLGSSVLTVSITTSISGVPNLISEDRKEKMSLVPCFFGGRRSNVFDPFSLDVWDPFKDFPFPNSLSASFPEFSRENSAFVSTRVDWKETPEAHVFKADIPGLKKEEVKVEVEDDRVLQISGERNVEKEDKNDKWHRVERSSGKFLRRFRLPENSKVDEVKASMENGVLTVTVPKQEVKKPDVKAIDISAPLAMCPVATEFSMSLPLMWPIRVESSYTFVVDSFSTMTKISFEIDYVSTTQAGKEENVLFLCFFSF